jgi:AraC-like DNA-binding protein
MPDDANLDGLLEELLREAALGRDLRKTLVIETDTRRRIDAVIANGYDDPAFGMGDVTAALDLSERRVRDVLDDENTSFRAEVLWRRMAKAKWFVVATQYTVSETAFLCGYRCASTFAARFRDATGCTPREFRAKFGGVARAGGTTGCFRSPAERARVARQGGVAPTMTRTHPTPGERAMRDHARQHARRRALIRAFAQATPQEPDSSAV